MKNWSWVLLITLALLVKYASTQVIWVEENYSNGLYPIISRVQRALFGWIPFSVGDLFYLFLILVILFKTTQFLRYLVQKKIDRNYLLSGLKQLIFFFLFIYVFFYGLWGLNYSRQGIAYQLGLEVKPYNNQELDSLTGILRNRVNFYVETVNLEVRDSFNRKKILFENTTDAYLFLKGRFQYLEYSPQSIKPSLFSYLGNYLGFQGYYNPFTGEAQVNTSIPSVLEPFVSTHEVAHQLGYAKENEANFVGFLACRSFPSNVFRYSLYFDMFSYAISDLYRVDSLRAEHYMKQLHPQARKDYEEVIRFYKKHKNPVDEVISTLYGYYLQANNQPDGKRTYNQVVAYLVAYFKKFGTEAL